MHARTTGRRVPKRSGTRSKGNRTSRQGNSRKQTYRDEGSANSSECLAYANLERTMGSAFVERFKKAQKKWAKKIQPLIDAARRSEQITGEDLRIVINARAD